MNAEILSEVELLYRDRPIAQDSETITSVKNKMKELLQKWRSFFSKEASTLSSRFASDTLKNVDRALKRSFSSKDILIDFEMNPQMKSVMGEVIKENVSLIKSIPQKHFDVIEELVAESWSKGRDLGSLVDALKERFDITLNRAKLITTDQSNKATAKIQSFRQQSLGIEEGEWVHSGRKKWARHSHVEAGRKKLRFDLSKGAYIDGEWILPGEKIRCGCTWRPVLKGFVRKKKDD